MVKNKKKAKGMGIVVFLVLLIALYVVIQVIPGLTGALTGTEIIQYGELRIADQETCYILRDETVYTAATTGEMEDCVQEGTLVKEGTTLFSFTATSSEEEGSSVYTRLIQNLSTSLQVDTDHTSQKKGILTYYIDGYEDYFSIDNMTSLVKEDTESLSITPSNIQRTSVVEGEPIFKIASNSLWYITFWIDLGDVSKYAVGDEVTVVLDQEEIEAQVAYIIENDQGWQIILSTDWYYSGFTTQRVVSGEIVTTYVKGLLISQKSVAEKDDQLGVYVKQTTGEYEFVPINIKASDGTTACISVGSYYDADGNTVTTVEVYDEILTNPSNAE